MHYFFSENYKLPISVKLACLTSNTCLPTTYDCNKILDRLFLVSLNKLK